MKSILLLRASCSLFCMTTLIAITSSEQLAQYLFMQHYEYPRDCKDVQRRCSTLTPSGVYVIKPDGFPTSFEVYCDNDVGTGGWTVIQRREHGFVNFNRTWSEYAYGFGFLSTEFWLGNEKLAFLTNQATYELLIEVELSNGSSIVVTYRGFRISGEFEQFKLQNLGNFEINGDFAISYCPSSVYFNDDCSQRCICGTSGLHCNDVICDVNAVCSDTGGGRKCSCNDGYRGDGLNCTPIYADCKEVYDNGYAESGVYTIMPNGWTNGPFDVFCEMSNGGGWTVFQRRKDDPTSFYQNWTSYREGFGNISESFWLGNEKLYHLTNQKDNELRFDITTLDGTKLDATFTEFQIESEHTNYTMNKLGSWSSSTGGTAGRYWFSNRNKQFSTYDRDNDGCSFVHCAEQHRSGWWHYDRTSIDNHCVTCFSTDSTCSHFRYNGNCYRACTSDNLNGVYNGGDGERIYSRWNDYCDIQFVEMKIRPSS